ncbi:MAG: hypothetical protein PHP02_09170 [Eubacteriales bacterium]|nr:hypothetical protein [Eubacteriales bacterium]
MTLARKLLRIFPALLLYSLGIYLNIQADIGLAPWEAFHSGVSIAVGLSFGNVVLLAGLAILLIDLLLKEKIGLGTVLNITLVGKGVDLYQFLNLIPKAGSILAGTLLLLTGQFLICLATYLYISAGLGSGPRDSLMVALGKRLPRVPVGAIRALLEGTALFIGWSLGAKVGLGTIVAVLSIGPIMQLTFRAMRFEVRDVRHESIADTLRLLRKHQLKSET